jgi:hypothetical protein
MKNVTNSTGTGAFYLVVNKSIKNKHIEANKVNIIDSKYLHPCTFFSSENCHLECEDCYVSHLNNFSWNSTGKITRDCFQYLHNNKGKFCLFIIFVILAIIYFSLNIL